MRSQRSRRISVPLAFALLVLLFPHPARGQPEPAPREAAPITRVEIARALERAKRDPNLSAERTIRILRWEASPPPAEPSRWLEWIAGLFRWVAETARVLVWVTAALAAGLLAAWLIRLVQGGRLISAEPTFVAPTHVRDLDIRPESLPRDIGAAARALWDRGEHRPALALLYRGLLSRLAHVHRVPIRDSTTEGDCLALSAAHLTPDRSAYAGRLVRAWQDGVYAGRLVDTATVHALCVQFAEALDARDTGTGVLLEAAPAGGPR